MRTDRAVRLASAWHARRPSGEELRDLADLILEVTRDDAALVRVVHELAMWCQFAGPQTAMANLIADHNRRAVRGMRMLPRLAGKKLAFQRCLTDRAAWAWLSCR